MTAVGYGPLWRVDGPPPQARPYTLLGAARIVPEAEERWANGVSVYPYPDELGAIHDACSAGTFREKGTGGTVPNPEFGAMTVWVAETCSSFGIFGEGLSAAEAQDRFVARASSVFGAVESTAVEREFLAGDVLGTQPFLADGDGTFPAASTAQTVVEGFALLEAEIAASGRRGLIHISPAVAIAASYRRILFEDARAGVLRTINGTTVVPGAGYQDASVHPAGKSAASGTQEWIYATGPVDVRRSETFVIPGDLSQALDRATNTITYLVERAYAVDWDTVVQASVKVDRAT